MKKIISLLLVACTCLCLCLSLTACGHEHTFKKSGHMMTLTIGTLVRVKIAMSPLTKQSIATRAQTQPSRTIR